MYTDTITLFNRVTSREGDAWYPVVLHGVDVNMDRAAILAKYGAESADKVKLHIKCETAADGQISVAGREYLPPKAWQERGDPEHTITFAAGSEFDFCLIGDWGSVEPITPGEYSAGEDFYTFLNRTEDYVFAISSVGGPYSVIPHFEILGR